MPLTKEQRKARRIARREERRQLKDDIKIKFDEAVDAVKNSNINIDLDDAEPNFVDAFNKVWPVVKPVLKYAQAAGITGEKMDDKIQAIIELGDRISTGDASAEEKSKLVETLDKVWHWARVALVLIMVFTKEQVDKIINNIIEIGDWITEEQGA